MPYLIVKKLALTIILNATGSAEHTEGEAGGTTVRDSTAVLLAGETIPGGSFYSSMIDGLQTQKPLDM